MKGQPIDLHVLDTGRTDAIKEAVADAVERHRAVIEADPGMTTLTLLIRLDKGPEPKVIYRTESLPPR